MARTSLIFAIIALAAAKKFQVNLETGHLDSSSFHVHGEYELPSPICHVASAEIDPENSDKSNTNQETTPVPIKITYGYSRDHRPDLKQFMVDLICSGDGDVPLFFRVGDGNESDSAVFAQIMQEFKQQLNLDTLMVADSALSEHHSNYGGVAPRWLVVESNSRRESDLRKLTKNIAKNKQESERKLRDLSTMLFACEADAISAAKRLDEKLKYFSSNSLISCRFC